MLGSQGKPKQKGISEFFKKKDPKPVEPSHSSKENEANLSNASQQDLPTRSTHPSLPKSAGTSALKKPIQAALNDDEEEDDVFLKPHPKRMKGARIVASSDDDDEEEEQKDKEDERNSIKIMPSTPFVSSLKSSFGMKGTPASISRLSSGPLSSSTPFPIATPNNFASTPSLNQLRSTFSSQATPASAISQSRAEKFKEKNDERYNWLLDIKDANGNPAGHPDYDPRTLLVPKSAWNKFTPFERQFWEIKSTHWVFIFLSLKTT